jgi:uncharacterized protein (TIGR02466 family)
LNPFCGALNRITRRSENATKKKILGGLLYKRNTLATTLSYNFLVIFLVKQATNILESQGYFLDPYELRVNGVWAQEIGQGGMHESHVHANTQMCGFFFLQTPKQGAYPIFSDPRPGKVMADFWTKQDGTVHLASPQIHFSNILPGTFMFFNAWLPHQLHNKSKHGANKVCSLCTFG